MEKGTTSRLRREAWGFAVGSLCFLLGALPFYVDAVGTLGANVTFCLGSVFFTIAAFIQFSLSGRSPLPNGQGTADRFDWWSAAAQFIGTLFFNLSTAQALAAAIARPSDLSAGWRPDAFGSIAFLASSALAIVATRDRGALWDPDARTWHGLWLNALGSVAFGVSAVSAWVSPVTQDHVSVFWDDLGTLIGALCFLVAALLSRRTIPAG